MSEKLPIAIDPEFCGCTECICAEYVPLNEAKTWQILLMACGVIQDNTEAEFSLDGMVIVATSKRGNVYRF